MKIIIITQNDPFYLGKCIGHLLDRKPVWVDVVACVLFKASPYGKKESLSKKIWKSFLLFGPVFFVRYGLYYLLGLIDRKSSLRYVLKSHEIPMITLRQNINHANSLSTLGSFKPDLLISIAGNQIFRKELLSLAPKGCLNLHTSLLPKYRGLMPTFWVLKNDEPETGVSVFFVDEGIDSGPIVVQKRVPIGNGETQRELIKKTKIIGMDAVIEAISLINEGNYTLIANRNEEKSYYSFPTRKDIAEFRRKGKRFF